MATPPDQREREKAQITALFDTIAPSYDRANRFMSMGLDKGWRKKAVGALFEHIQKDGPLTLCDVATGTGDLLEELSRQAAERNLELSPLGVDPSEEMLRVARSKHPQFSFRAGEASSLPLDSHSQDLLTVAFGLRNVVDLVDALREFKRVLKPGGTLLVLEFFPRSRPSLMGRLAAWYTRTITPRIGALVSSSPKAYRHLPASIDEFAPFPRFQELLAVEGFSLLQCDSFLFETATYGIFQTH